MSTALLLILLSFRGGLIPVENIYYSNSNDRQQNVNLDNSYFAEFKIEAIIFYLIFIRGSIENTFNAYQEKFAFSPDHDEYVFSFGIKTKYLEVGFLHKCYHPIHTYQFLDGGIENIIEGGYEEIYLQFNSEIKF